MTIKDHESLLPSLFYPAASGTKKMWPCTAMNHDGNNMRENSDKVENK